MCYIYLTFRFLIRKGVGGFPVPQRLLSGLTMMDVSTPVHPFNSVTLFKWYLNARVKPLEGAQVDAHSRKTYVGFLRNY